MKHLKKIVLIVLSSLLTPTFCFALTPYEFTSKVIIVNGLGVCAKKYDIPKISHKKEKWHIDRQCCLDPYEIPNPFCHYGIKYQYLIYKYNKHFNK
jgi:hypothetical protein